MKFFAGVLLAAVAAVSARAVKPLVLRDADDIDARIYLIRHGEKIDDDHIGLSNTGKQRAQCVKNVFAEVDRRVDYIIVQDYKSNGKRIRPYNTVKPLADKLGLEVDHHCDKKDEDCVYDTIKKAAKDGKRTILVCWEHKHLTDIAEKLGIKGFEYPDDRFDVVFSEENGKVDSIFSEECPGLDDKYYGWVGKRDSDPKLISESSWADGAGK